MPIAAVAPLLPPPGLLPAAPAPQNGGSRQHRPAPCPPRAPSAAFPPPRSLSRAALATLFLSPALGLAFPQPRSPLSPAVSPAPSAPFFLSPALGPAAASAPPRPANRPRSGPAALAMTEQEKAEWENLNKLLMRHGLKPVSLAAPQCCRNASAMIVLDSQSSLEIRLALKTLMEDIERQQKLMQGLMETNRGLRDLVRQGQGRASRQEQRANELENVVENIKTKIRQLEDETIAKACQQQNQVKEFQKDQQASQVKYQQQQEKLQEQEEIIARLQKELSKVGMEERRCVATQNKMFCQFCKRAPKSLLDQR
ncbi:centrosomal protein of 70 kDa-like isoform X2 [Pithys albifrons albifrons]